MEPSDNISHVSEVKDLDELPTSTFGFVSDVHFGIHRSMNLQMASLLNNTALSFVIR